MRRCRAVASLAPQPNAYARIVTVDGGAKKIVIFAGRVIEPGEEVVYDYKFPLEDDDVVVCYCGADSCSGRMN